MECCCKRNDEQGLEDLAATGSPRGPSTIVPSSTDGGGAPNQADDGGGEARQPVIDGGGAPGERTGEALIESTGGGGPSQTRTGGAAPSESPTEERQVESEQLGFEKCAICSRQFNDVLMRTLIVQILSFCAAAYVFNQYRNVPPR